MKPGKTNKTKASKPTKASHASSGESVEQRDHREAWALLGELLGAALVAAEQDLASRFAAAIRTRLHFFALDKATRRAMDKALAGPCETDEIIKSFGFWADSRELTIVRSLVASWTALTEQPDFEPIQAWRAFVDELRERLAGDVEQGQRDAERARGIDAELVRLREEPLAVWPLEPAGDLRERVRAWRDAAVERGASKRQLVDPDSLRSTTTFSWQGAPLAVGNLSAWLDDRAAWSRVLAWILPLQPR